MSCSELCVVNTLSYTCSDLLSVLSLDYVIYLLGYILNMQKNTHLSASFVGPPWVSQVKPVWILLEHEMMGWRWQQLDHMHLALDRLPCQELITF